MAAKKKGGNKAVPQTKAPNMGADGRYPDQDKAVQGKSKKEKEKKRGSK